MLASCETPWFQNIFFGHLNHFTEDSLRLLALNSGFIEIETVQAHKTFYPSICGIFQKINQYEVSKNLFEGQARALDNLVYFASSKAKEFLRRNKKVAF